MYEFWRGVFVQKETAKLGQTFIDFPPAQKGASFNLDESESEGLRRSWPSAAAGETS